MSDKTCSPALDLRFGAFGVTVLVYINMSADDEKKEYVHRENYTRNNMIDT